MYTLRIITSIYHPKVYHSLDGEGDSSLVPSEGLRTTESVSLDLERLREQQKAEGERRASENISRQRELKVAQEDLKAAYNIWDPVGDTAGLKPKDKSLYTTKIPESSENILPLSLKLDQIATQKEGLQKSLDEKISERMTRAYARTHEKLLTATIQGVRISEQRAVELTEIFKQEYNSQIQNLIKDPAQTKDTRKLRIQEWRKEFFAKEGIDSSQALADQKLSEDLDFSTNSSWSTAYIEEEDDSVDQVRQGLDQLRIQEQQIFQEEYRQLQSIPTVNDGEHQEWIEKQQVEIGNIDSNASIDAVLTSAPGQVIPFSIAHDGGYTESVQLIHAPDGSYIIQTSDGGYMRCSGDKKDLQYTLDLFRKCAETPLVRRMMNMGDVAFDVIRTRIQRKYPEDPTLDTNPDRMIKKLLLEVTHMALGNTENIMGEKEKNAVEEFKKTLIDPNVNIEKIGDRLIRNDQNILSSISQSLPGVFDPVARKFSYDALVSRI